MNFLDKIIGEIEIHSVEGIQDCFDNGVSPNAIFKNKPLVYELITEYGRGPSFSKCIQLFIDNGLEFEDKVLLAVLANDADALGQQLNLNPTARSGRYTLDCAFTPLFDTTLLHICAEYNHVACAVLLIKNGADVNAIAGVDELGFGGHTPIFHTVNQNGNKCIDMMRLLLENNTQLLITIKGLIWGKGYQWETYIPSVNPISYAMMGLLRQFQRREDNIYDVVGELMKHAYGIDYTPPNVPNAYLAG
ncbi:MAG: ankyrin repeat domain-containing protein [Chitinophagaceae bacterium]|nr:MAG: ankyrin repeat domain-containing protein [Chitinophagaceae bacterium]